MTTEAQLTAFIARQRTLLAKERDPEVERSSLLLSNCGPKLLEQKGLSLGGLGVSSINIGLGGKTFTVKSFRITCTEGMLWGGAGTPNEMEDLERNTVV